MSIRWRRGALAAIVCCLFVSLAAPCAAEDPRDEQVLAPLRARRSYAQIADYCQQQLADPQTNDERRADLSIELTRALAQQALAVNDLAAAEPLWRASQKAVDDFVAARPGHPRLLLVRLQGALGLAAEAEQAAESAEAAPETAKTKLRTAIAAYRTLAQQIEEAGRRRATAGNKQGFGEAQLYSLADNVQYELARVLRQQALFYPAGSADRINALTQAQEALVPVARQSLRTRLAWLAVLETAIDQRLLEDFPAAQRELARLDAVRPIADLAPRLRAERIRLALARGAIDEALAEAGAVVSGENQSADVEQARLEAFIAAWRRGEEKNNAEAAGQWQRRAFDQAQAIQQTFGARAARQAETLLGRARTNSKTKPSAEALASSAAGFYRGGKFDQAVEAYDQAVQAADGSLAEAAFDWMLAAATIEKNRKHFDAAGKRYHAAAERWPDNGRAADAHLLAVYCAAQAAQAQQPPRLDAYQNLLEEHVSRFGKSATAPQAWCWLGRLAEYQGDYPRAIDALGHVQPRDAQFAQAVETTAKAYEAWLAELNETGASGRELADRALAYFEGVLGQNRKGFNQPSAATRAATLAAARIWLAEMPTGGLPSERLLSGMLQFDASAPPAWQADARRLLYAALVAQDKNLPAEEVLAELPHDRQADLLALLAVLSPPRARAEKETARRLATAELAIVEQITRGGRLDEATTRLVGRSRAGALAALDRRDQGAAELKALAKRFPKDGQIPEDLAALLSQGDDDQRAQSLVAWRELAQHSRPGTGRWYRAQLGLARTQIERGDAAAARATIQRVSQQDPALGGAEWKRRFDALNVEP